MVAALGKELTRSVAYAFYDILTRPATTAATIGRNDLERYTFCRCSYCLFPSRISERSATPRP